MKQEELNDAGLRRLVEVFYSRVRVDAELGPIFNDAVNDWPEHLGKLAEFWSSVMLASGRYKGQPVPAHMIHQARMTPEHFERWLDLWTEATVEVMEPIAARALQEKARRIAQSLQLALFFRLDDARPLTTKAEAAEPVA